GSCSTYRFRPLERVSVDYDLASGNIKLATAARRRLRSATGYGRVCLIFTKGRPPSGFGHRVYICPQRSAGGSRASQGSPLERVRSVVTKSPIRLTRWPFPAREDQSACLAQGRPTNPRPRRGRPV